MKQQRIKTRYLVNFAAAAVLFSACANSKQSGEVKSLEPVDGTIPVAVINADTIFSQYQLAIELREQLTKKQFRPLQSEILSI